VRTYPHAKQKERRRADAEERLVALGHRQVVRVVPPEEVVDSQCVVWPVLSRQSSIVVPPAVV
jgi:hypothetical protein